ncbi:ATP-binding cassette domain-containing protein [Rufibacter immobilis]|uniref:ATP-binding cassette domain-containing protein n=1 Tax=Rufibacter immobilis TaxID=1348778 RepID=A0A3M9N506_9BACT|nr:ABC transporter transmembrane domain-containing protein [Rufibacter immobilis]RNI32894.1 ATP-binding cassette domain-containing protein [Rufibacter immobilis]
MAKRGFGPGAAAGGETEGKAKLSKENLRRGLQIFRFLLPYRGKFYIGLVFLLFSSLTFMAFPAVTGMLIDAAVGKPDLWIQDIDYIAVLLFAVIALQGIFSFFRVYFFAQVSENAIADIRKSLYTQFMGLPLTFFEQRRVGEITSRITSDVSYIQDGFSITLAELFRQITTLLVGIGFIMFISVKLSLFMLATFPVLVILAMVFGKKLKKLSRKTQDELAVTNVIVEETLQAIQVVKAFTNELFEINRYKQALGRSVKTAISTSFYRGAFISFIIIGLFGGIILVIWYGATLVQRGDLTFGQLTSFILYTSFIGASVAGLGDLYAKIQVSVGASERILEILDLPLEQPDLTLPTPAAVRFNGNVRYEHVGFSYPTRPDLQVLQNIHFEIRAGEKIALVGSSGAGKSTIAQLLMKFYKVDQGAIYVDGQNINQLHLHELRGNMAIVPQEVLLFGGTIKENIAYGRPDATEEEVLLAAQKANALQFIQSFPEAFNTVVGERGIKLSGGQRQRIAIARAILKDPAILILDEATSSLDSESEMLVQQAMDELMKNRTTIIIAHRLATIRKVDKILVIDKGQIVEQGSHDELAHNPEGIYANLLRLQFEAK